MTLIELFPLTSISVLSLINLAPLFFISLGAVVTLILGTHKQKGHLYAFLGSLVTLILALSCSLFNLSNDDTSILNSTILLNPLTKTAGLIIIGISILSVILTYGHDRIENLLSEVYALILFSTAGMILLVSTQHLLFMFISIEIMSLAIYVLVAMRRTSTFSSEAGLKYFILGGLASAIFLYGSSLVFGATGSFQLAEIHEIIKTQSQISFIYYLGLGLIITAMLFKVGAVPFHGWLADVYQGASTNITAYMGAAVKFTAFFALMKICEHLVFVKAQADFSWFHYYIWFAAAASMIYGNLVAISQNEIKRMLAFSTIAHTGYLLLGLYALKDGSHSLDEMIIYLTFYAVSNIGAFAIILQFEEKNQKDVTLNEVSGLGLRYPWLGSFLSIFLLSMAGIPLTSGFIGKYGLFNSAIYAGEMPLVIVAVLSSVVSVYYYLRVIVHLFMKEEAQISPKSQRLYGAGFAAFLCAAATLQFGLFPKAFISFIKMISK